MIKITLKSGVIIEGDNAMELAGIIKALDGGKVSVKLAQGGVRIDKRKYNGACRICGELIPKGSRRWRNCGSKKCLDKSNKIMQRNWARKKRQKIKGVVSEISQPATVDSPLV